MAHTSIGGNSNQGSQPTPTQQARFRGKRHAWLDGMQGSGLQAHHPRKNETTSPRHQGSNQRLNKDQPPMASSTLREVHVITSANVRKLGVAGWWPAAERFDRSVGTHRSRRARRHSAPVESVIIPVSRKMLPEGIMGNNTYTVEP